MCECVWVIKHVEGKERERGGGGELPAGGCLTVRACWCVSVFVYEKEE